MANSALKNSRAKIEGAVLGREVAALAIGTVAESIATAGGTVPAGTTRILFIPEHAVHWHPTGTPTSTFGHAVAAGEPVILEHEKLASKFIRDAGGDTTAIIIYLG